MTTGSQPKFSRVVVGYDPVAVDACVDELMARQQLLLDDIETLRARLKESCDEVAALRKEVAFLNETSPSPHAVPQRMAKLLRHAIDEVSEMQAEAKAEVQALVATIESEAETAHRKHEELLADMSAQRSALEAECAETRSQLEAELAAKRAETQSEIDDAMQKAQQDRDQLLAEARQEAERLREEARRVVDEANQQRIKVLEQLMDVYRGVETIPAALESAYQDRDKPPEAGVVVPFEQKRSTG
ncbi:ATP synthase F0 subunit B [Mycobacterium celatum]|uniref:Cell division protein DivIVA n=1 Tax=Mycobacterium celatum TaxID=28045 RepID=A0A1X1RJU8_MYCCE|nr:ATP synthase F0 subunit B [Mycobacterium celatum]ORV07811.1 cell division protein DivIVA [Mycobacterium celatum]PIB75152.1 cell division protein DivIVA [Mycobacterium celatum]